MATAQLKAEPRARTGKGVARTLRAAGRIPAVIYGHTRAPQALSVGTREVERLFERVAAASTVIELEIAGAPPARTLIREIQRHPFKQVILHIDFQELVAGEKVRVRIPLAFQGTPEGVRVHGGILEELLHELEIEVDPSEIPSRIVVDVGGLTIGHSLHVRDLAIPAGATITGDADVTVALVSAPKAEAEKPTAEAAEAPAEPEVLSKGKKDDEAAEPTK
jgi:large subunit ribosomal protein L25